MTKPKRHLDLRGKQERAAEAKAVNKREAEIAKAYLNAGPSIGNLVRAAYHWYNSVPMLGGQNENGLNLQTGEAPSPGMRNPKNTIKNADALYETFVKRGNFKAAKRMLADKAKSTKNIVTDNKGNPLTLYRADEKPYNVINEHSKSPIFLTTDEYYANQYGRYADDIRTFYGFGKVFNAAPVKDINSVEAEQFFKAGDINKNREITSKIHSKYYDFKKGLDDNFHDALDYYRRHKNFEGVNVSDEIKHDVIAFNKAAREEDIGRMFFRGAKHWDNKKYPYGYFKDKEGRYTKNYDDILENNYDAIRGHDSPIWDDNWQNSEGVEYAFKKSNQVKLNDITYDDEGKLIPLSERFNLNVDDNRYGLIPIGVGAGYAAGRRYLDEQRPQHSYGGSIHISPSKKGTFTAAATKHGMGVQEFAARVLRNKEDYSPSLVKKANFARNASKWNH